MNRNHPAYVYAKSVIDETIPAPRYVKKQCAEFLTIAKGEHKDYIISAEKVRVIESVLSLIVMAKGLKAGTSAKDALAGFQWFFLVAVLATVYRENTNRRRYQTAILEICRKNGKTFLIGVLFVILLLTEPRFSKLYSVAPDGALSREVKSAIEEIIKTSPALSGKYNSKDKFKINRDVITFNLNDNSYIPLNYSNSRLDGRLGQAFLCDEAACLPSNYAIEAMRSGQLTILNKLGCIISTKYPKQQNPFEDEIGFAKKVLDGIVEDETVFALLYEPDDSTEWMTDDLVLKHGNPLALDVPEIWDDLLQKRAVAIEVESKRENFLCKHCNIIYSGAGTETFIPMDDVIKCRSEKGIDWEGREVYLGVDLSMTNDNTAVAMVAYDESSEKILAKVIAFIPEGRIEEKNRSERIDYRKFVNAAQAMACGDRTIDYKAVEDYVLALADKYGVMVSGIGFDRYNCLSSAQKWEDAGLPCTEVRQHSSTLHPPTKWLFEMVSEGRFEYDANELLEINFENSKCTFDTNLNRYVSKKKSNGKVDMVIALINAVYMLQQNTMFGDTIDWIAQII